MSDPIDDLLREAAARDRAVEIPQGIAKDIVARAATKPPRRRSYRRRLAIALGALVIAGSATTVAVPGVRDTIGDAFDSFRDFFAGGGDAPGTALTTTDPATVLPWLTGIGAEQRVVVAENDGRSLIGYRDVSTGEACLALDNMASMCAPDAGWPTMLKDGPIFYSGPFPPSDGQGRVTGDVDMFVFGIADDTVGSVAIRYADGGTVRVDDVRNGFVLGAAPSRKPRELIVYGHDGAILQTYPQDPAAWRIVR